MTVVVACGDNRLSKSISAIRSEIRKYDQNIAKEKSIKFNLWSSQLNDIVHAARVALVWIRELRDNKSQHTIDLRM